MRFFQTALLSVSAVLLTSSFAFGQAMGGGMGGGMGGTGGAQPPANPAAGTGTPANPNPMVPTAQLDRNLDLPMDAPKIAPPTPTPPTPPENPTPVTNPNNPPTIYGKDLKSENGTVVYVIDISGSMGWDIGQYITPDGKTATGARIDRAKAELTRSVTSLPMNFKFNMVSFDCSYYPWMANTVPADAGNKSAAIGWISMLQPQSATGTGPATAAALSDRSNKLLVLLTDGAPNCGAGDESGDQACMDAHRMMIDQGNTQHAVINVFGIGATGDFKAFCMQVAADNAGSYTDVR